MTLVCPQASWRSTPVAVKKLFPTSLHAEEIRAFERELAMYRRFNSPFVVLFMGAVLNADAQMLVFELMAEGQPAFLRWISLSLYTYIETTDPLNLSTTE